MYVVSYDIVDDRRRLALAEELKNFDVRVQRSLFECHLDAEQFTTLWGRLAVLVDPATDRIRCYRVCGSDLVRIQVIGSVPLSKDWDYFVV
jgi:CRISPR-associated protein Cas2